MKKKFKTIIRGTLRGLPDYADGVKYDKKNGRFIIPETWSEEKRAMFTKWISENTGLNREHSESYDEEEEERLFQELMRKMHSRKE